MKPDEPKRSNGPKPKVSMDNKYAKPTTCRFGTQCHWRPNCSFYHAEDQSQAKLKPRCKLKLKEVQPYVGWSKGTRNDHNVSEENVTKFYLDGRKPNKPKRSNCPNPRMSIDNKNAKPTTCRFGTQCHWRPNCRFYHAEDQSQAKLKPPAKLKGQGNRNDRIVSKENAIECYLDGKCTGESFKVRTRNPGQYWYEGGLVGCLPEGRGIMEYEEGLYQGEWRKGKRHGLGRAEYWDEEEYVSQYLGDWENGRWDGEGVTVLRNGKVYDGVFKHNCRSGRGKLTMLSGSFVEGDWRRCRLVGEGTITIVDEDGVKEEGNRKMVLECFENDDCEITELYDNFIEKVVEDVSSKILRGSDGPFVPSKQRSQVGRDMM